MRSVRFYRRPKVFVFSRNMLRKVSCLFFILVMIVPLLSVDGSIGKFTRSVFSYWTAADKDFGKLKFVDNQSGESVDVLSSHVLDFNAPFASSVLDVTQNGENKIRGASDMFRAIAPGNVVSISSVGRVKIITIDHGSNIKSIYEFEGMFCVKNGDRVDGDYIGIAKNKSVLLTIVRGDDVLKIVGINGNKLDVKI